MTSGAHDRRQEGARIGGVGEIITKRVGNRVGHDDLGREMRDRFDIVLAQTLLDQRLVADVADHEFRRLRNGFAIAGGEIVDHHDLLARIEQGEHHMAADIAGAPGHQYGHDESLSRTRWTSSIEAGSRARAGRPLRPSWLRDRPGSWWDSGPARAGPILRAAADWHSVSRMVKARSDPKSYRGAEWLLQNCRAS